MSSRKVKLCGDSGCQNSATTEGYCRMHYLKNWKKIKVIQEKKAVQNLNKYIDHVMQKHPEGYVEAIREDLKDADFSEKKADTTVSNDDYYDVMDELNQDDVGRIIGSIKIDDSF